MMRVRAWMVGGSLLALAGLVWVTGRGFAGDAEEEKAQRAQNAQVLIAAAAFKSDKEAGAKKVAEMAKNFENLEAVMHGFKPRKKFGFGVGKAPGAITPDGIELYINSLQRDGITATALGKAAAAIEEMAYITAAIGQITKQHDNKEFGKGKKKKEDWIAHSERMIEGSLKLAAAAKAKGGAEIKSAAKVVNDACNACHSIFRE